MVTTNIRVMNSIIFKIFLWIMYIILADIGTSWILNSVRSTKYLSVVDYLINKNFFHIENLYVGPSEIAGEGVFSQRKIRAGTVVLTSNDSEHDLKINDGDFPFPERIEYHQLMGIFKKYKLKKSNLTDYHNYFGNFHVLRANRNIKEGEELTKYYGPLTWLNMLCGMVIGNYFELQIPNLQKMIVTNPEADIKMISKVAKKMGYKIDTERFLQKIKISKESIMMVQLIQDAFNATTDPKTDDKLTNQEQDQQEIVTGKATLSELTNRTVEKLGVKE